MKNLVAIALTAATVAFASPVYSQSTDPKAPVQDFYAALNGEPAKFADALASTWIVHGSSPAVPDMDFQTYGKVAGEFLKGLPSFKYRIDAMHVAGEFVTVRGTVTATHGGMLFGVPATGNQVEFGAIDIHRVEGNRIAESWHIEDFITVLGQIGGLPKAN
jgi:predicted ester cyclase